MRSSSSSPFRFLVFHPRPLPLPLSPSLTSVSYIHFPQNTTNPIHIMLRRVVVAVWIDNILATFQMNKFSSWNFQLWNTLLIRDQMRVGKERKWHLWEREKKEKKTRATSFKKCTVVVHGCYRLSLVKFEIQKNVKKRLNCVRKPVLQLRKASVVIFKPKSQT